MNYNFAFFDQVPELDWDQRYRAFIPQVLAAESTAEYYRLLQRFCALLQDGHTNIYPPDHVKALFDRPQVRLRAVQGRAVVVDVGASLAGDLPRGSEILTVDGLATAVYLQAEIFPYISSSAEHILRDKGVERLLDGPVNTLVDIEIRTPEGRAKTLSLERDSREKKGKWVHAKAHKWQRLEFRWLEDGIAYVILNTFGNEEIVASFERLLPELGKSKGLILDIRKNGGGSSGTGYAIIKHLTDEPFLGSRWKTREHRAAYKAWGGQYAGLSPEELERKREEMSAGSLEWFNRSVNTYNGTFWYENNPQTIQPGKGDKIEVPVAVLIGHKTGSAAEDFLIALDSIQRAVFVGRKPRISSVWTGRI
ncbi:MAG: peptidase S41 [Gemmatimonadetes bacterium]|nr:peptidase S41 [Gemmatimonadota bacterium]